MVWWFQFSFFVTSPALLHLHPHGRPVREAQLHEHAAFVPGGASRRPGLVVPLNRLEVCIKKAQLLCRAQTFNA